MNIDRFIYWGSCALLVGLVISGGYIINSIQEKQNIDIPRFCIQQAIFETGTDPSKWPTSKYIFSVVKISENEMKVQLEKQDGKPDNGLWNLYKTTDNEFIFKNGEKLFDGRDLRSQEEKLMSVLK